MNVDELVAKLWMQYSRIVIVDGDTPSRVDMVNETGFKFAIREAILQTSKAQWIPVSERLPEMPDNTKAATGTMVLVDVVYRVVPAYFEADREFHWLAGGIIHSITHWMPLPSPPTAETSAVEGK